MTITLAPNAIAVHAYSYHGETCPRCAHRGADVKMAARADEHMIVTTCPSCDYEVRDTSAGMRAAYRLSRRLR